MGCDLKRINLALCRCVDLIRETLTYRIALQRPAVQDPSQIFFFIRASANSSGVIGSYTRG
jgi:hypothetical protein